MIEPLAYLYKLYNYDYDLVKEVRTGLKYTAVLLKNGKIGVCANLLQRITPNIKAPSLRKIDDRILLNAYYNALLNYNNEDYSDGDIFDLINFSAYEYNIMIGDFKPLYKKFIEQNIPIYIFDKMKKADYILDLSLEEEYLSKAETLILSATTISNNSFMEIINKVNKGTQIYLLGPSAICSKELFKYQGIKGIFGGLFKNNDQKVLNIIKNDGGTRDFIHFMKKIAIF